MFTNCVFKVSVDTKQWLKSTVIRAIKTFAQTAASMISVGLTVTDINWKLILGTSFVALVYSVLTSIVGLPEVPAINTESEDLKDTEYNEVEDLKEGDM